MRPAEQAAHDTLRAGQSHNASARATTYQSGGLRYLMQQVTCQECGALILQATADKTGGVCMPCKMGIRESIEASKLHYQKERELNKTDPFRKLWIELVDRVHGTDSGYTNLSNAEKKYFAVGLLDGEVYNGGFDQYFFNSSSSYYYDAEVGLEEMGAMQTLSLLRRAKQIVFGAAPVPEDTERRRDLLRQSDFESHAHRLGELDDLFWKDPDGLSERAEAFARRHRLV